ncbi:unnamed protein product [Leptidea sinapis]|uniref:Fork-head domain-containing protein n=2 Tax=Leptidea sinapis TaxID=189913 RepID=A0A5E4QN97_9NEOP|nr:unnamed protein product [Leptidea sinapis]
MSPTSGEMLDTNLYGDSGCFQLDHAVPESSHTVEIEYIYEQPQIYAQTAPEEKIKKIRPKKIAKDEDTDLTNLNWLQNITNIMSIPQLPISPVSPSPQTTRLEKFNKTLLKCQEDFHLNRDEYKNSEKKPPYSYSTLICMAMRCNNNKMTLSAIYSWIRDNFRYYQIADPTWQNSIRHNLSLNKVFAKVARSKHEPGKGGFWKLDLTSLEGTKRISNRPIKKKKVEKDKSEISVAVSNIPQINNSTPDNIGQAVTIHLPEFVQPLSNTMEHVGANVIVEPAVPPPLMAEDDLSSLLLNPTEWDDLQLDMFDYLDPCFK